MQFKDATLSLPTTPNINSTNQHNTINNSRNNLLPLYIPQQSQSPLSSPNASSLTQTAFPYFSSTQNPNQNYNMSFIVQSHQQQQQQQQQQKQIPIQQQHQQSPQPRPDQLLCPKQNNYLAPNNQITNGGSCPDLTSFQFQDYNNQRQQTHAYDVSHQSLQV